MSTRCNSSFVSRPHQQCGSGITLNRQHFKAHNSLYVSGALSALTKTPSNVVIEKGDEVHMECSTDAYATFNTITWQYDGAQVVTIPCTSSDTNRLNISNTNDNDCDIIAYYTSLNSNQGPYHCSDGSGKTAEAMAILIGIQQLCICHSRHCIKLKANGNAVNTPIPSYSYHIFPIPILIHYPHRRDICDFVFLVFVPFDRPYMISN